jgi:hypothetical protein
MATRKKPAKKKTAKKKATKKAPAKKKAARKKTSKKKASKKAARKFMILHYGFQMPAPEVMKKWQKWFGSIAARQTDQGGFMNGVEISKKGAKELPFGRKSITGYNIIEARSLKEAEKIAAKCPFIDAIRVYELRAH